MVHVLALHVLEAPVLLRLLVVRMGDLRVLREVLGSRTRLRVTVWSLSWRTESVVGMSMGRRRRRGRLLLRRRGPSPSLLWLAERLRILRLDWFRRLPLFLRRIARFLLVIGLLFVCFVRVELH